MIDFIIPEGKNSANVQFLSKEHKLIVSGKSYPENAKKFFDEVYQHLKNHKFGSQFFIVLDLDYISSSSVIGILEMLKKLKALSASCEFKIDYIHEEDDDDMLAIGENYQKVLGTPFNFIVK